MAWVAEEGNLDASLARQIALGQRRIQGHLLAQILSQQAGFSVACELSSWRIQRLAVTPSLQGRGIGSKLLQRVYGLAQKRQVDFVGASFSASSKTSSIRGFDCIHLVSLILSYIIYNVQLYGLSCSHYSHFNKWIRSLQFELFFRVK